VQPYRGGSVRILASVELWGFSGFRVTVGQAFGDKRYALPRLPVNYRSQTANNYLR